MTYLSIPCPRRSPSSNVFGKHRGPGGIFISSLFPCGLLLVSWCLWCSQISWEPPHIPLGSSCLPLCDFYLWQEGNCMCREADTFSPLKWTEGIIDFTQVTELISDQVCENKSADHLPASLMFLSTLSFPTPLVLPCLPSSTHNFARMYLHLSLRPLFESLKNIPRNKPAGNTGIITKRKKCRRCHDAAVLSKTSSAHLPFILSECFSLKIHCIL